MHCTGGREAASVANEQNNKEECLGGVTALVRLRQPPKCACHMADRIYHTKVLCCGSWVTVFAAFLMKA